MCGPSTIFPLPYLQDGLGALGQCVHHHVAAAREARRASPRFALGEAARRALARLTGGQRPYIHQAQAVEALIGGGARGVAVASATASGKSACFLVPLAEFLATDARATAVLTFPTKALAQDQLRAARAALGHALGWSEAQAEALLATYDGDTPQGRRELARAEARVLFTNVDMLHRAILPQHRAFERLLRNLRLVVVDEAHVYTGVFGCHAACIMRRLRRVVEGIYAQSPRFALCSATMGDPGAHAAELTGLPPAQIAAVTEDGSPRGAKDFLLWNPPLVAVDDERMERMFEARSGSRQGRPSSRQGRPGSRQGLPSSGKRGQREGSASATSGDRNSDGGDADGAGASGHQEGAAVASPIGHGEEDEKRLSSIVEVARLLAECVQHGVRTIAFCKTKKLTELVLRYTRETFDKALPEAEAEDRKEKLMAYRGGYAAEDRRAIERRLFSGELLGVAATNALELGVDVGELDCTLHLGWPGSVASLWQQAGRAGRRQGRALAIMVAFNGPLDQWFMRNPKALFERRLERCFADASAPRILRGHLACAAHERTLTPEDSRWFGGVGVFGAAARAAREAGELGVPAADLTLSARYALVPLGAPTGGPAAKVDIRTICDEAFVVKHIETGEELESIEANKAFWQVYPGALYMNQRHDYTIVSLDIGARVALARPTPSLSYFTSMVDQKTITTEGGRRAYQYHTNDHTREGESDTGDAQRLEVRCGAATLRTTFHGYVKQHRRGWLEPERVDFAPGVLPDALLHTRATWVDVPEEVAARLRHEFGRGAALAGAHAAAHALLNVLSLFVAASPTDVAAECDADPESAEGYGKAPGASNRAPKWRPARILLYEKHEGGIGLAERIAARLPALARAALAAVAACRCGATRGCPGCVVFAECTGYNKFLHRKAGQRLLEMLTELDVEGGPEAAV